ncbi:hypothetical protein [Lacticaseibacillus kribbianus]|uniref:hypothetical protein n=1 Tax=Lacticaseibacillus kribbianus TaxID=2926292 RepID=UPI001CD60D67|nr:hypothetical protein [Lacticaseibacillus kribbianus]
MTAIEVLGVRQPSLQLPDEFVLVATEHRSRNVEKVRVERYQAQAPPVPFRAHATLVYGNDDRLLSFNRFTVPLDAPLPDLAEAQAIARRVFTELDPDYAAGLEYIRTDKLRREVVDAKGAVVPIPIRWVKFTHENGSYNWVSVGAGGAVVEYERESMWDYRENWRATEEWNYDQWVLARAGKAVQPPAPEAVAWGRDHGR